MTMIKSNGTFDIQKDRLNNVLDDLNISQADVVKTFQCNNIAIDSSRMSNFVTGQRRITPDVLIAFHTFFFINPKYIKGKSDDMYDIPKTILNYALSFASKITVTENPRRIKLHKNSTQPSAERYLHITMDEKFYDYLIHLDSIEEASEKTHFDKKDVISGIKELYKNGEHTQKEYVLLPRNTFLDILKNDPLQRAVFQELIDITKHHDYQKCKEKYKIE